MFCCYFFVVVLLSSVGANVGNVTRQDSAYINKLIAKGDKLFGDGRFDEAIDLYRDVIPLVYGTAKVVDIKLKISECYFCDKQYKKSKILYLNLLDKYTHLQNNEHVLHNAIMSMYNSLPDKLGCDISDTQYIKKYINIYKSKFPYGKFSYMFADIRKNVIGMRIRKDYENIKSYFDDEDYSAVIFLCDDFLNAYNISEYSDDVYFMRAVSECKQFIKKHRLRGNHSTNSNEFLKDKQKLLAKLESVVCSGKKKTVINRLIENVYRVDVKNCKS